MNQLTAIIFRLVIRHNQPIAYLELPGTGKARRDSVASLIAKGYVKRVRTGNVSTIEWTGKIA